MAVALRSLGLLLGVLAGTANAAEITIRADEWLPYNGGSTLKPPGYMIEMAQAIAARNGHTVEYRTLPWERALDAVRKGTFDCVVGAYLSDAEGFAFPSVSWGKSGNHLYGFDDNPWRYSGPESLSQVRIGVLEEYSYGDELDAYIAANKDDPGKVNVAPGVGRGIVMLIGRLVGRKIDIFVEDLNVAAYGIERAGMTGRIIDLGQVGEDEDVYIACTPAHPRGREYADMFGKGTQELRNSGELKAILDKYKLRDWAAP